MARAVRCLPTGFIAEHLDAIEKHHIEAFNVSGQRCMLLVRRRTPKTSLLRAFALFHRRCGRRGNRRTFGDDYRPAGVCLLLRPTVQIDRELRNR